MKRSKPTSSASSSHGLSSEDLAVLLTRHDLRKKSLYVQVSVDPRAVAGTSKLANELYDYCDSKPASLSKDKGKAKAKKAKDSAETDVEKELLCKIQLRIWACDVVLKQIHQTLGYKFMCAYGALIQLELKILTLFARADSKAGKTLNTVWFTATDVLKKTKRIPAVREV